MPDWATVLIAAFGGGLVGAVLQPVVSYALQRVHSGEEIRKRRERTLRRMVEVEMDWARYLGMLLDILVMRQQVGLPALPAEEIMAMTAPGLSMFQKELPRWNPERIPDGDLRQWAEEYYKVVLEVSRTSFLPQIDSQKVQALTTRLDALQIQMRRRMDDLNWPEADD